MLPGHIQWAAPPVTIHLVSPSESLTLFWDIPRNPCTWFPPDGLLLPETEPCLLLRWCLGSSQWTPTVDASCQGSAGSAKTHTSHLWHRRGAVWQQPSLKEYQKLHQTKVTVPRGAAQCQAEGTLEAAMFSPRAFEGSVTCPGSPDSRAGAGV